MEIVTKHLACNRRKEGASAPAFRLLSRDASLLDQTEVKRNSSRPSYLVSSCSEEDLPEGWGRLSLVWPVKGNNPPNGSKAKGAASGAPTSLVRSSSDFGVGRSNASTSHAPNSPACRKDLKFAQPDLLPSIGTWCERRLLKNSSSSNSLESHTSVKEDMSGLSSGGAGPGSAASYSSLRRGIKATTSKIISATSSVKRPGAASFPSLTPLERSITERSDPVRFEEGVSFKGKLIGVLEVAEARGDRMCQEALAELKIAVRAAGEHKQRIAISVAMDGIRLRDERTGDCLHHHPVHKISFIAQDMTDTRAFGYIFGSPDAGHKFFGIKTEKAASQVVIAMRDLFQVVFELKKKEIEKAKAQLREGSSVDFKDGHFDPFGDSFKPSSTSESVPASTTATSAPKPARINAPTPAPLAPPPMSGRTRHDSQSQKLHHQQSLGPKEFAKFPVDFKNLNQNSSQDFPDRKEDRYAVFKDLNTGRDEAASLEVETTHRRSVGSASSVDSYAKNDEFETEWILIEPNMSQVAQGSGYDVLTELDPLGTGKIRPFIDKKDFFNDIRKATARRLLRELGDGEESQPGSPRVPPGIIPAEVSALVASSSIYSSGNPPTLISLRHPATSTHVTPVHTSVLASHSESFSPTQTTIPDGFQGISTSRECLDTSSGFADFNQFADSPRSQRSDFSGSNFDEAPTSLSVGSLTVALPPESFRDSPPPFSPPPLRRSPARSASGSSSPQQACQRHSPFQQSRFIKQMSVTVSPLSPKTLPRNHKFFRQISHDSNLDSHPPYLNLQQRGLSDADFSLQINQNEGGGISPRPRPRSSLSKLMHSGSATLPLRSSHRNIEITRLASVSNECRPFPNENFKFDEAPEPPPRPAHVEPPPLPPKRLPSHITLRPPPRPPTSYDPHYDYESSPEEINVKSPPIPVPARKPRYLDSTTQPSFVPDRGVKPILSEGFHFPKTCHSPTRELTGAVPKTNSRGSTSSKSSTPGKSPRSSQRQGISPCSVDLANTSLDQLASTLDIPVDQLAKMTVVELAACLAQVQLRQESHEKYVERVVSTPRSSTQGLEDDKEKCSRRSSIDWPQDKFTFDEEEMFAKFDAQFPKSPVNTPTLPGFPTSSEGTPKFPQGAPVSEDRYAVFKELSSSGKQKSVFDENFLTPQNSLEDEVSEVSSGTFKANFDEFYHDSIEQKSSISDEIEAVEGSRNKWDTCERIDHECSTVFRSPDISEYENFEPNFEGKFEDDFSAASLSERSNTPVNSPAIQPTFYIQKKKAMNNKNSPFTDDFSKISDVSSYSEARFSKISNDDKFVANFNDYTNCALSDRGSVSSDFDNTASFVRQNSVHKSPFEDNFSEYHVINTKTNESEYLSNFQRENYEKYDHYAVDKKLKRMDANSQRTKRSRSKKHSLDAPNGSINGNSPSPFEDDFIKRTDRYEVLRDLDNEREPSIEGEVCNLTKQDEGDSPFEDSWHGSQRNTPYDDQKSIGSLHSIQEEARNNVFSSPYEDNFHQSSRKDSNDLEHISRLGSDHGKSPYSESFTLNHSGRSRGPSRVSLGSEGSSEIRHSPFDDCFNPLPQATPKETEDSFSSPLEASEPFAESEKRDSLVCQNGHEVNNFANFENAFQDARKESDPVLPSKPEEKPTPETHPGEDPEDGVFPEFEAEFKVSARFAKPEVSKAVEDPSIFSQEIDPFADDFFSEDPEQDSPKVKNPKDPFWQESFDNFPP